MAAAAKAPVPPGQKQAAAVPFLGNPGGKGNYNDDGTWRVDRALPADWPPPKSVTLSGLGVGERRVKTLRSFLLKEREVERPRESVVS